MHINKHEKVKTLQIEKFACSFVHLNFNDLKPSKIDQHFCMPFQNATKMQYFLCVYFKFKKSLLRQQNTF